MKKALSLILAVVMMLCLLAGCGDKPNESTAGGNDTPATEAPSANKRTDVNLSITQAMTTVDPHGTTYVQDRLILWQAYEGLTFYNELTGGVEPALAESWDVSDGGTVYTFHLREAYFHNGDKVTAEDAAFSIMRCTDPANPISMYGTNIKSAEAIDEKTVKVTLASAYAPFMVNSTMLFVINKKIVEQQGAEFGTKVADAGTGPYKFTYIDLDERITLEAFDKYWKGEASIKKINYYPITDTAAGVMSFEAGNLDWYNCSVTDYKRLMAQEGKYGGETMAANHITFLAINPNSPIEALHNEKVRQAIAYAINKDEMNMAAFDGLASVADYLENPDWNYSAPRGFKYEYNPEKAKQLLAEAGYPNGVDVGTILDFTGSHFEICGTVLQAQLEAVGIHAKLEWAESATCLARGKKYEYDLYCTGGNCTGDYDNLRKRFYSPLATKYVDYAAAGYDAAWLDEMIDKSAATADLAERTALNLEINDYLMNTATYLPLLHKAVPYVWNKDLNVVNRPVNPLVYDWSWK